jgi:hypothetical protein
MRTVFFIVILLMLLAVEILHSYFIMPFPGSQRNNTIDIAYWINNNIWWMRIIGLALLIYPVVRIFHHAKVWKKMIVVGVLLVYVVVFYFFNFRFKADKMFYQPRQRSFANAAGNKIPLSKLVIGVVINGEAKAYPVQLIGYHHQVRDTIGATPVMVTYCTVCRTGRAYSLIVNGKNETFRLVGMDHFNAMFEDATTKSWWRQVSGLAIAGPLKGKALQEIPSRQSTLAAWLRQYPSSLIMQPDTAFAKQYKDLEDFDKGTIKSSLEKRDSASWKFKSWVIGIGHDTTSKAYDWNDLVNKKILEDSLPGLPIVLVLEKDTTSFHIWNRQISGYNLHFTKDSTTGDLKDDNTQSIWNMDGLCTAGPLKGNQLQPVQGYQEFWHSWQTFHPNTLRYQGR